VLIPNFFRALFERVRREFDIVARLQFLHFQFGEQTARTRPHHAGISITKSVTVSYATRGTPQTTHAGLWSVTQSICSNLKRNALRHHARRTIHMAEI